MSHPKRLILLAVILVLLLSSVYQIGAKTSFPERTSSAMNAPLFDIPTPITPSPTLTS